MASHKSKVFKWICIVNLIHRFSGGKYLIEPKFSAINNQNWSFAVYRLCKYPDMQNSKFIFVVFNQTSW